MHATEDIPKNLRERMSEMLRAVPEPYLGVFYEAMLHAEKVRLLDEISKDAEGERAEGKWDHLPELIQQVRSRLKAARLGA